MSLSQVVTYCRVSSEEQALKDLSIPAQRKALRRWAQGVGEVEIAREFVDEGLSAYAPAHKRPGFCEMIAFCRKASVEHILVHKLDRFSRDREESILFKALLRKHGVTVKSVTEQYDPETPQGFLYEGMIEVINQFYSMNLATETVKGMRENAERGYCNGGRVPYGYRLERFSDGGAREHSKLVPGPEEEVAVIREIFDLAGNEGLGVKAIANLLNAREVPPPRGRHWSGSSLNSILNNRAYVGDRVWNRRRKNGRETRVATPEEDWIIAEDAHEPLVDRGVFERRQELAATRRFNPNGCRGAHTEYLLGRLIRCTECGYNYTGRRKRYTTTKGEKKEHADYVCNGYQQHGRSVCEPRPIEKGWIEGLVVDLIRSRLGTPEALAELERRVRQKVESRRRTFGESTEAVERKIAEVDRQIANYYRAIGEGLDPLVCRQHIDELTETKVELEVEAEVVRTEDYYQLTLDRNLRDLRQFAEVYIQDFERLPFGVRRKVVLHFIESIEVVEHRLVRITMRVPFDNAGIKHLTDEDGQGKNGEPRPGEESLAGTGAAGMSVEKGNFFQLGTNWLPNHDHRQNSGGRGGGAHDTGP
jgi:site-specific DNA recombinase